MMGIPCGVELRKVLATTVRDSDGDEIQGACCLHSHICSSLDTSQGRGKKNPPGKLESSMKQNVSYQDQTKSSISVLGILVLAEILLTVIRSLP